MRCLHSVVSILIKTYLKSRINAAPKRRHELASIEAKSPIDDFSHRGCWICETVNITPFPLSDIKVFEALEQIFHGPHG